LKVLNKLFQRGVGVAMLLVPSPSLLLISFLSPASAPAQDQCPTVSQVKGSWEPKVQDGQEVCVGTLLHAKKDASITIEFKEKKLKVKKICVIESGCEIPVLGPGGNAAEQTIVNRIFAAFARTRLSMDNGAVLAVSRGLEAELQDCVVQLKGMQVDLGPTFKEMKPGKYWVRIESLPKAGDSLGPFEIQWTEGSAFLAGAELKTGLQELALVEKTGEPAGSEAWILVTDAEAYKKQSSSFEDAVRLFQKWRDESDPVGVRIVLRAYLESLADAKSVVQTP
jgi:hypothetical protein